MVPFWNGGMNKKNDLIRHKFVGMVKVEVLLGGSSTPYSMFMSALHEYRIYQQELMSLLRMCVCNSAGHLPPLETVWAISEWMETHFQPLRNVSSQLETAVCMQAPFRWPACNTIVNCQFFIWFHAHGCFQLARNVSKQLETPSENSLHCFQHLEMAGA